MPPITARSAREAALRGYTMDADLAFYVRRAALRYSLIRPRAGPRADCGLPMDRVDPDAQPAPSAHVMRRDACAVIASSHHRIMMR